MSELQSKILEYLRTTKEASVYEIQAGIDLWTYNPLTQIRTALTDLLKAGEIKRGAPSKYRIATKQAEDKQINLF